MFHRKALLVHIYLRMNRVDLAVTAVNSMKLYDDEHVLTTLAHVWVNIQEVRTCGVLVPHCAAAEHYI